VVIEPQCPAGQRWDGVRCVTITCTGGQVVRDHECVSPVPRCPQGRWNGIRCVPTLPRRLCPGDQYWNGQQCMPRWVQAPQPQPKVTAPPGRRQPIPKRYAVPSYKPQAVPKQFHVVPRRAVPSYKPQAVPKQFHVVPRHAVPSYKPQAVPKKFHVKPGRAVPSQPPQVKSPETSYPTQPKAFRRHQSYPVKKQ
jgi:hypothetical protein